MRHHINDDESLWQKQIFKSDGAELTLTGPYWSYMTSACSGELVPILYCLISILTPLMERRKEQSLLLLIMCINWVLSRASFGLFM